jgi:hypothetical protein
MLSEWLSIYQRLDRRNRIEMTRLIFQCLVYQKHRRLFSKSIVIPYFRSIVILALDILILRKGR